MMDSKTEFQKEEKEKNLLTGLPLKDESINKKKKKRKNRKSKAVEILELKNEGKEENLQTDSFLENELNHEKKKITDESDEFQREEVMEENLFPHSESNKKRKKRKSRKRKSASVLMKVTNENEPDSSDPVSANVKDDNTGQVNPGSNNKNKQNNKKSVVTDEDAVALKHAKISSKDLATSKHYDLSSDDLATFEVIYGDAVSSETDVDLATFEVINRPSDEDSSCEHDELISTLASELVGEHPVASELVGEHPAASEHDTFSDEGSVTNEDAEPYTESPISSVQSEPANASLVAFESEELTCTVQGTIHPGVTDEDIETLEHDGPSFGDPAIPDHIETFVEGKAISEPEELTEGDSIAIENEQNELTTEGPFILELYEKSDFKLIEEGTVGNIGHTTDSNILVSDERSHLEDHLSFPSHTAPTDIENRKSSSWEVTQPTIADILVSDEMPSITLKDENHPSYLSCTAANNIQPTTPDIIVSNKMISFTLKDQDHPCSSSCTATDSEMQCRRSFGEEVPQTTPDILLSNDISSVTLTNEDNPSSPSHAATDDEKQHNRSSSKKVMTTTPGILVSNDSSSITLKSEDNPSSSSHTAADIKTQYSGPSSSEKVIPEPLGLFSMLVAVLVFCLIIFCHAFCASFLIFKKPSPQKLANKQKINSDEAHN